MRNRRNGSRAAMGFAVALVCVGIPGHAARAEQTVLAGQTLNVDAPSGYCAVDRSRSAEASLVESMEKVQAGSNKVVLMFIECAALAKSRASGNYDLSSYGVMLSPTPHGDIIKYSGNRQDYVEEVAKQFPDFDAAKAMETAQARIKESGVSVTGIKMLGLLAKDDTALYVGVSLEGVADPSGGAPHRVLGMIALTLVNEIPISVNIYRADAADDAITGMIAQDKANVAALIAANASLETESRRWIIGGIDLSGVGSAALIGAAIGAAVGAVLYLVKKLRKSGSS